MSRFSLYACGNGVNLPHVAKHAFGDQMGPNVQKAMPFGGRAHSFGAGKAELLGVLPRMLPHVRQQVRVGPHLLA